MVRKCSGSTSLEGKNLTFNSCHRGSLSHDISSCHHVRGAKTRRGGLGLCWLRAARSPGTSFIWAFTPAVRLDRVRKISVQIIENSRSIQPVSQREQSIYLVLGEDRMSPGLCSPSLPNLGHGSRVGGWCPHPPPDSCHFPNPGVLKPMDFSSFCHWAQIELMWAWNQR